MNYTKTIVVAAATAAIALVASVVANADDDTDRLDQLEARVIELESERGGARGSGGYIDACVYSAVLSPRVSSAIKKLWQEACARQTHARQVQPPITYGGFDANALKNQVDWGGPELTQRNRIP